MTFETIQDNKELFRELGPSASFYLNIILYMFKRRNATELHISSTDFLEFTNDTYYNINKSLLKIEKAKLLERTRGGHGNVNFYKLTGKSLKLYAVL